MGDEKQGQGRALIWAALGGLLGLFVVGLQRPSGDFGLKEAPDRGADRREAVRPAPAPAQEPKTTLNPLKPLIDFLATATPEAEAAPARQPVVPALFTPWAPKPGKPPLMDKELEKLKWYELECLIVTVPDPVDSRFGLLFDRVLDAVQRAMAGVRGYEYDRSWLPWEEDKHTFLTKGRIVDPIRDKVPGLLLFRGGPSGKTAAGGKAVGKDRLCLVFLVGEEVTAGINKRAFLHALDLIAKYGFAGADKPIRVVGPTFTGSQASLRLAIAEGAARHPQLGECEGSRRFEVISGSATAVDLELFNYPFLRFRATAAPNHEVIKALLHYLRHRNSCGVDDALEGRPDGKVAYLVEATSGFGGSTVDAIKGEEERTIVMRFPLHISRLKEDTDRARRLRDDRLGVPTTGLVPALREELPALRDVIPSQDPATTAASNGKVLQDILAALVRERVKYVGVVASDVRDRIFLAYAVRERCPGVRLFLVGSDALLKLPEYSHFLQGTLIGSTYPLVPVNHRWVHARGARQAFPDNITQGTYNAILAHMGEYEQMVEYRPPLLPGEERPPGQWQRPPIWITMVGQNGEFTPLHFFRNYEVRKARKKGGGGPDEPYVWDDDGAELRYVFEAPPRPSSEGRKEATVSLTIPGGPLVVLIVLTAFASWVLVRALRVPSPAFFWNAGPRPETEPEWAEAVLYRAVCLFALFLLFLPLAHLGGVYLRARGAVEQGWGVGEWISSGLAVSWYVLLLAAVLALLQPAGWWGVGDRAAGWGRGRRAACAAAYAAAVSAAVFSLWWTLDGASFESLRPGLLFFFERSMAFGGGLSPLVPLFLLTAFFFCWGFYQLRRSHLAHRYNVECPFPAQPGHHFSKLRGLDDAVQGELQRTSEFLHHRKATLLIYGGAVALVGLWVYDLQLPLVEGPWWGRLLAACFLLGFFLTGVNLTRLLLLWSRVRALMDEIVLLPMAPAFERLPPNVVSNFAGYLYPSRPRFSRLRLPAHLLPLLTRATKAYKDAVWETDLRTSLATSEEAARQLAKEYEPPAAGPAAAGAGPPGAAVAPPPNPPPTVRLRLAGLAKRGARLYRALVTLFVKEAHDGETESYPLPAFPAVTPFTARLLEVLAGHWPERPLNEAYGSTPAQGPSPPPGPAAWKPEVEVARGKWVELAESFAAIHIVLYVSQFFVQMRNLATTLVVCSCLLLLAGASYPFVPQRLLLWLLIGLIGVVVLTIVFILVRINQNELVSRITRTTPNRFTPDAGFVSSLFTYVVPAVGVVALQMSGALRFIFEPILRVFK